MKRNLIYFTASYPYGLGEQWKTNELTFLKDSFQQITVVPFSFAGNKEPKPFIPGITYTKPLIDNLPEISLRRKLIRILFSKHVTIYLSELFSNNVIFSKRKIISWVISSYKIHLIYYQTDIKKVLSAIDNNTILYFFWGRETIEVLSILKKIHCYKIASRFHGYDLYAERSGGYIPYQSVILKKIDLALPCSNNGKEYLQKKYPKFKHKIQVARLGTVHHGFSQPSYDQKFRLISCSAIIKIKRVELIAKALGKLNIDIEWTHIGGGDLFDNLQKETKSLLPNIKVNLLGWQPSTEIMSHYINNHFDLFVHVSSTEGVPVSIMEALSAGLPVYATNAGGTSEIIDDSVGKLLPIDITPEELALALSEFYNLDYNKKEILRANAFKRFSSKCDATTLSRNIAQELNK